MNRDILLLDVMGTQYSAKASLRANCSVIPLFQF